MIASTDLRGSILGILLEARGWFHPLLWVGLVLALMLPGCGRRPEVIRVSGAWALYPLMVKWAEVYNQQHPGTRVEVSAGGAGKGMTDCLSGLVDIAMVSRDLRREELNRGAYPMPVVRDAVFAVISVGNPSAEAILRTGFGRQVLQDLFLRGKGQPYTRSDACGAAETWAAFLGARQEDLKGIGVYGDPGIAAALRRDPRGVGYNNLAFAFDLRTGLPLQGLAVVSLDVDGNGKVDPSEDVSSREKAVAAIREGHYPSPPARDILLVTRGRANPATSAFLRWIFTEGQALVDAAGFVPVREDQRRQVLALLDR